MIRAEGIWHHFGIRPVLEDVTLEVAPGELVALMGPNGMGKSTLLSVLAGTLSPWKGFVEVDGVRRRSSPEAELAIRQKVVYLPDDAWLPAERSGREFVLAVGRLYGVDDERLFDHVDRLMNLFHLEGQADAMIRTYSAGQRKKIALASALVSEAPIMLLDEPFSGGLDPSGLLAMKRVLAHLAEREDVTIVIAVPVPQLVEELASRIALIRDGRILAYDSPAAIRQAAGTTGPLEDALEKLLQPKTLEALERYFERRDA